MRKKNQEGLDLLARVAQTEIKTKKLFKHEISQKQNIASNPAQTV